MTEFLFCRFNARGRKQFKNLDKNGLKEKYPEYANLGLPAHKAALNGNVDVLKEVFISCNEDGVPSRDRNGATPLHLAVRNNSLEAVKWLTRYTDLSPLDVAKHGETPVHVAAAQGHTDCLKLLVNTESKTDIKGNLASAIDNSGFTALHLATVKLSNDCAKLLIAELGSKGVGPLSESGVTAAHVAASSGNVEVLKMISQKHKKTLSHQAEDGTTPLYFAAQEGRLEALKFLAEKCKCNLSTPSEDGLKPIHAAAQCGHSHIVKYIVSQKGNQAVFEQTPEKATPLHFAACGGKIECARWLINSDLSGALITAKDKNGDTPAHDAADNGQTAVLKLLLESGADLYAINNEGNTPYSLALSGGNPDMANFVMSYASKSPQKMDQEPSKMTIYDLQGDVDIVDFQVGSHSEQQQHQGEQDQFEAEQTGPISTEPTRGDKSSSFLKTATQTLQSFDSTQPNIVDTSNDDLEWTEEELDIFKQEQKPAASSGTDDDIVVRYSADLEYSPKKQVEQPLSSEYATVNEIAMQAEKREKKRGRKISKSIQSALKSRKRKVSDAKRLSDAPKKGFSGNEMGFKPQFHSNPLQRMSGPHALLPRTPPPTPATAASNEAQHHKVIDDDDDEDNAPYDMYATPDPEVIKMKAERRKQQEESENTKLLEDTLEELSRDNETPPPIPEQTFSEEKGEEEKENEVKEPLHAKDLIKEKPVSKVWPPPSDDIPDRPHGPNSGSSNVLKKWPPANGGNSIAAQLQQKKPAVVNGGKKWAPPLKQQRNTPEKKPEPVREPLPVLKPPTPKAPEPVVSDKPPPSKEEPPKKMFAVLKPVKRDTAPKEQHKTELSKIKLKRAEDKMGAIFSHPESEQTSGASDELKQLLTKVAN